VAHLQFTQAITQPKIEKKPPKPTHKQQMIAAKRKII